MVGCENSTVSAKCFYFRLAGGETLLNLKPAASIFLPPKMKFLRITRRCKYCSAANPSLTIVNYSLRMQFVYMRACTDSCLIRSHQGNGRTLRLIFSPDEWGNEGEREVKQNSLVCYALTLYCKLWSIAYIDVGKCTFHI